MNPDAEAKPPTLWSRTRATVLDQLTRGLSPRRAALAVALGAWLGVIPVLGATMSLCLLVAWLLRLNHAVVQASNLLVYPLQLLLLIPFLEAGARIFGGGAAGLDLGNLVAHFKNAPWVALREYGWMGVHACAVWCALGLVVVPCLWWLFTRLFTRLAANRTSQP